MDAFDMARVMIRQQAVVTFPIVTAGGVTFQKIRCRLPSRSVQMRHPTGWLDWCGIDDFLRIIRFFRLGLIRVKSLKLDNEPCRSDSLQGLPWLRRVERRNGPAVDVFDGLRYLIRHNGVLMCGQRHLWNYQTFSEEIVRLTWAKQSNESVNVYRHSFGKPSDFLLQFQEETLTKTSVLDGYI